MHSNITGTQINFLGNLPCLTSSFVAVELSEALGDLPDLPPAVIGLSRAMRAVFPNDFQFIVFLIERKENIFHNPGI